MAARKKTVRKKAKRARKSSGGRARARLEHAPAQTRGARKRKAARPGTKPRAARTRAAAGARPAPPAPPATTPALQVVASAPVLVARVLHYFGRAGAGALALLGPLALGDWIHVRGATSDFVQRVTSLRVGARAVERAEGCEVGIGLCERARPGDRVFALRASP